MFSGLEVPSIALNQISLDHRLLFIVESDPALRKFVDSKWKPGAVFSDALALDYGELPDVDLMVGGPPCQAFARGGKHGGLEDPRGPLTYVMLDCVEARSAAGLAVPKAVVMEQSKTLLGKYRFI